MLRRWWHGLDFYWQVYLIVILCFGTIIALVEGIAEPIVINLLEERFQVAARTTEIVLWVVSVLVPTFALGFVITHMVVRRMTNMVKMAKRLKRGDLTARIDAMGNDKDVFNQLAGVFNGMADSLERLIDQEKRLLADVSHELCSPLTRMGVAAALLPTKRKADEVDAIAKLLDAEINQMNVLVGMLLQQRRERLKDRGGYSSIDLSGLARDMAAAHTLVAVNDGKNIDTGIEPGIVVLGNLVGLRMIIENVVSNALFYSPPSGRVEVRVWRDGKHAFFAVRDYGQGVPEKSLRDIFRAFFRVDPSRARTSGGAGLGLTLAHDAAVAMGGDIEARNAEPGLEVIVTLPLTMPAK